MNFLEERIGELLKQLSELRYQKNYEIPEWRSRRVTETSKGTGEWQVFYSGGEWAGHRQYYEFTASVTIPEFMDGKLVEFYITTGREGQWDATNPQFAVYVNGKLRQGMDMNHRSVVLGDMVKAGEVYEIFLAAFTGDGEGQRYLKGGIRTVDVAIERYYYDCLVPWQTAGLLDPEDTAYLKIIPVLNASVNFLDFRRIYSQTFYDGLDKAGQYLQEQLYQAPKDAAEATVFCVGHTHIDVAWLWTLAVTRDKAVRSFSTVIELMDRYPEYTFMSSQPQLYLYVKEREPELFEKIKAKVAEGRWEPEGGMFLEADCNLTSGESLVRQFLYGKRFFKQEFGVDNEILWLPDVFGYSAALPQIMEKCGIRYFMTTKISWNETNKMPYDTFYWQGIDGSKILTHFICARDYDSPGRNTKTSNEHSTSFATTYNAYINPSQIKGTWQRYQQKELNREVLVSYGYGDGGGGPTREMLETHRRLSQGVPGCPSVKQATAGEFFHKLEQGITGKQVPLWAGELYLEFHRGTYTSMARNKKSNRQCEFGLENVELYGMMASNLLGTPYPDNLIKGGWEVVMRNQFHDILPGSSIKEVYEDSKVEYDTLAEKLDCQIDGTLQSIADAIKGQAGDMILFNPNGFSYKGLVEVDQQLLWAPDGESFEGADAEMIQRTGQGNWLIYADEIPSKGYAVWDGGRIGKAVQGMHMSADVIENDYYRIKLNECGQFVSYYDKEAGRELLKDGQFGNVIMSYEDKPHDYDNWNIYEYYKEKCWEVNQLVCCEVIERGPLRYGMKLHYKYLDSDITEIIYCYADSRRVDMAFDIDWKESQIMLKALFPLELNSYEAEFEIQYGNVKRSTTRNTSWEQARFEVCYHKWLDIPEGGYGVSFLNDCKYGVSIEENTVGLTLLKSGVHPYPEADRERHCFTYSIYPHMGTWKDAGIQKEAYQLNNPSVGVKKMVAGGVLPEEFSFVKASNDCVAVEVVKKAEDDGGTVVRLFEYCNTRTEVELAFGRKVLKVVECNMLEEEKETLAVGADCCRFLIKPFEIKTLKVYFEEV